MHCEVHSFVLWMALISICSTQETICNHDSLSHRSSNLVTGVSLDSPVRQKRSVGLTGLRIHVHYDETVLASTELANFIKRQLNSVLNFFRSTLAAKYPLAHGKRLRLRHTCVDDTLAYCSSKPYCKHSCAERSMCGPSTIPANHLDSCRSVVGNHCIVNGAAGDGLGDTDFVLYVSYRQTNQCLNRTLAYASYCQLEDLFDRPIAGYVNICPSTDLFGNSLLSLQDKFKSVLKHELFHALGFTNALFAFYRDENGRPRTSRDPITNMPPYDTLTDRFVASSSTIRQVDRDNWLTRYGVGKRRVVLLVTPNVRQAVRDHFNCSTLEGAELENQGSLGTASAHFEKRLFENEALTGSYTQRSVLSRLTLAVMDDTGWYHVNYSNAQPLAWGKALGCQFATLSCLSWINNRRAASLPIAPFCDTLRLPGLTRTWCNYNHDAVVACNLVPWPSKAVPSEYQYFNVNDVRNVPPEQVGTRLKVSNLSSKVLAGSIDLADYCPFLQELVWNRKADGGQTKTTDSACTDAENHLENDYNVALEVYGTQSACVLQATQWKRIVDGHLLSTLHHWGSGCYRIGCDCFSRRIMFLTSHDKVFASCTSFNETVSVQFSIGTSLYMGSLLCPHFDVVCPMDGFWTGCSRTDGSRTDGSRTDGSRTDGSRTDGSRTDGSRTDGSSDLRSTTAFSLSTGLALCSSFSLLFTLVSTLCSVLSFVSTVG